MNQHVFELEYELQLINALPERVDGWQLIAEVNAFPNVDEYPEIAILRHIVTNAEAPVWRTLVHDGQLSFAALAGNQVTHPSCMLTGPLRAHTSLKTAFARDRKLAVLLPGRSPFRVVENESWQ